MRFRRRNITWLTLLGILVAIVALSGAATLPVTLALMGLYAVALAGSLIEFRSTGAGQRRVTVPGSPLTMMRMSAQAREATERARRRGGYGVSGLTLLD